MRDIAQSNYLFSRNINFSFDISPLQFSGKIASTYDTRYVRNYDNIPSMKADRFNPGPVYI